GVIVDQMRRRSVLVFTAFASALVVAAVPLAASAGGLRIELLYAVSFVAGCLMVVEGVAFQAFLLPLLGRGRLIQRNAALWTSARPRPSCPCNHHLPHPRRDHRAMCPAA